ncbi:MAG TPA: zf-HC2 domain-containing protein [Micromonosporaceae bacterium]|nr:zf-HC2 domain-containing protein [Micromonosporaceae bacterium]
MQCDDVREALSARIDGEPAGVPPDRLDAHLAGCGGCRSWLVGAEQVTRLSRLRSLQVPDLTAGIVAAVTADADARRAAEGPARRPGEHEVVPRTDRPASAARDGRRQVLRLAVAAVAVAQLLLVVPTLLSSLGLALPAHTRHELAIFDTALAAGLLLAAWRPALARAYLPIVWIVAGGLATTALVDMVHGTTTLAEETGHLIAVVQAALLWGLSRSGEPLRRAALAG